MSRKDHGTNVVRIRRTHDDDKDLDDDGQFIGRRICIGLLLNSDYVKRVKPVWQGDLVPKPARTLARLVFEYYDKYGDFPAKKIRLDVTPPVEIVKRLKARKKKTGKPISRAIEESLAGRG